MSDGPDIVGVEQLSEIGRGGFGVVYRGVESEFQRDVAVKVLSPSLDERMQRRFERERRAQGALSGHPNIVTVYRGGVTGSNQPYLVMEYLPGGSLSERLRESGPMSWQTVADVGAKLADALASAHSAGVLHRDVKPGNIFQTATGEPKLGDFGIARLDDGQDSRSGSITASVAHAAPEIVDGQGGDERSDLYSLASTLYALVRGHAPFQRDTDQGLTPLLARIANEPPPPLHLGPDAAGFEAAIMRGLSKSPADRQPDIAVFAAELRGQHNRAVRASETTETIPPVSAVVATGAAPAVELSTVESHGRKAGVGQIAGFVALALAIAGFGGWAVSRAIDGPDGELPGIVAAATAAPTEPVVQTPAVAEPTPEPATPVAPTPVPATPIPATAVPTVATPTTEAGALGIELVTVTDPTGAITISAPATWAETVFDGTDPSFDELDIEFSALAIGGDFDQLGGSPDSRDLTRSGVVVFATRLDETAILDDSDELLDLSLETWEDCTLGERSQLLLDPGNADTQILSCDDPSTGATTGVLVIALVTSDDPDVVVVMSIQFSETAELAGLIDVTTSLRIDTANVRAQLGR